MWAVTTTMPARDELSRYELLASAVAGRTLAVATAGPDEASWTDGQLIWVRDLDDERARRDELLLQAALLGAGSLEPEQLQRLVGRPGAARRYLWLEGCRALRALADVLPGLEPTRLGADLDVEPSESAAQSLERALSKERIPDPPPSFGVLRPSKLLATRASADDGGRATPQDQKRGAPESVVPELREDEESDDVGRLAKAFSSPIGSTGPITRLLHRLLGLGRAPGTGPAGAELPIGAARIANRPGAHAVVSAVPIRHLEPTERPAPGVACYPEWDARRQRYRPDWCTVHEVDPPREAARAFAPRSDVALRRQLARLGVDLQLTRRERQGVDLDLDAVVELEVERRLGDAGAQARVYVDQLRRRRDLAVLVLVDISGSSGERDAGGRSVHVHQRYAAAALLDALTGLGDRVAVYGFHSRGRALVHLVRVKAFEDPLDSAAYARLGALEPSSYTRLGAAIRHAAHVLETRSGTPRRLLVVLSDGFAYDHGYEGPYAEADARRALVEAREAGIGCLCLSIGTSTQPDALRRVFEPSAYAAAARFEELRPSLGRLFRRALETSDLRRRLARRGVHLVGEPA